MDKYCEKQILNQVDYFRKMNKEIDEYLDALVHLEVSALDETQISKECRSYLSQMDIGKKVYGYNLYQKAMKVFEKVDPEEKILNVNNYNGYHGFSRVCLDSTQRCSDNSICLFAGAHCAPMFCYDATSGSIDTNIEILLYDDVDAKAVNKEWIIRNLIQNNNADITDPKIRKAVRKYFFEQIMESYGLNTEEAKNKFEDGCTPHYEGEYRKLNQYNPDITVKVLKR